MFFVLSWVSSCASPCFHEVFHENLGEAVSEIARFLCESEIHCGRIWTVLFLYSSARVSLNSGKIWKENPALAHWRSGWFGGGVTNKARTCIFAGHGRRQNKMWHLREQCYSLLPSRSPRVSHCQSMQQHSAVCPFSVLPSEANSHGGTGKERTALHYLFPTYRQRKPIRTGNPDTCLALTDSPQILLFCTSISLVIFPRETKIHSICLEQFT